MPHIETQKEFVTALSRKDIDGLTAMIVGKGVTRTPDKAKAIQRFEKRLAEKLGKESAEDEAWEILGKPAAELAEGALHAALEDAPAQDGAGQAPEETGTDAVSEPSGAQGDGSEEPDEEAVAANDPDRSGMRGKASAFKGKQIFPAKDTNPRRAGTHGFRSMALILDNPGLTYESFIKLGGRRNDLAWDVTHGNVTLSA